MAANISEQAYDSKAHLRVAIRQLGGNVELPMIAFVHELHRLSPALDYLERGITTNLQSVELKGSVQEVQRDVKFLVPQLQK